MGGRLLMIQKIKKLNWNRKVKYCLDDEDFIDKLVDAWGERINNTWTLDDVFDFHDAVSESELSVSEFLQELKNV
jgi:hypothetical protein